MAEYDDQPQPGDERRFIRALGVAPLSDLERRAMGLGPSTPGGFYQVINADRLRAGMAVEDGGAGWVGAVADVIAPDSRDRDDDRRRERRSLPRLKFYRRQRGQLTRAERERTRKRLDAARRRAEARQTADSCTEAA
jgi:hypothetical protein